MGVRNLSGNIFKINFLHGFYRVRKDEIWIPDLQVVNRIHDYSPLDEKTPKRKKI